MEAKCPTCGHEFDPQAAPGLKGACPRCVAELLRSRTGNASAPVHEDDAPPLAVGAKLGKFEVLEYLGRGGMGFVYKAKQAGLERMVALKVLAPRLAASPEFAARFGREAKALAALSHPNIVQVHDYGEESGLYFLAMEFVDGTSLRRVLSTQKLSPETALRYVPQICNALEYAHGRGIIHRDIKPENILIDKVGNLKIADFGLAKMVGAAAGSPGSSAGGERPTLSGQAMGTPHYMAPEQVENMAGVDHRADIYSLGVVFYEMLTGELPLGRFPSPSQKVHIDVRFDEVVLKALEKEPEKRYQRASFVKDDVSRIGTSMAGSQTSAVSGGRKEFSPLALAAFVLALIGLPATFMSMMPFLGLPFFLTALVLGVVGRRQIRKSPERYRGSWAAVLAIWLSLPLLTLMVVYALGSGSRRIAAMNEERLPARPAAAHDGARICWGTPVNGLQAELAAKQAKFEAGRSMEFQVRYRNAGKAPLQLLRPERRDLWAFDWELVFASKDGRVARKAVPVWDEHFEPTLPTKQSLRPGETAEETLVVGAVLDRYIGGWQFEDARDLKDEALGPIEFLPPGKYAVTARFAEPESSKETWPDGWTGRATTGPVEIEIVKPAAPAFRVEFDKGGRLTIVAAPKGLTPEQLGERLREEAGKRRAPGSISTMQVDILDSPFSSPQTVREVIAACGRAGIAMIFLDQGEGLLPIRNEDNPMLSGQVKKIAVPSPAAEAQLVPPVAGGIRPGDKVVAQGPLHYYANPVFTLNPRFPGQILLQDSQAPSRLTEKLQGKCVEIAGSWEPPREVSSGSSCMGGIRMDSINMVADDVPKGASLNSFFRPAGPQDIAWGDPVDGLRLGLAPRSLSLAEGEAANQLRIWVENKDEKARSVPVADYHLFLEGDKAGRKTWKVWTAGLERMTFNLNPDKTYLLVSGTILGAFLRDTCEPAPGETVNLRVGVNMNLRGTPVEGKDRERWERKDTLKSGTVTIARAASAPTPTTTRAENVAWGQRMGDLQAGLRAGKSASGPAEFTLFLMNHGGKAAGIVDPRVNGALGWRMDCRGLAGGKPYEAWLGSVYLEDFARPIQLSPGKAVAVPLSTLQWFPAGESREVRVKPDIEFKQPCALPPGKYQVSLTYADKGAGCVAGPVEIEIVEPGKAKVLAPASPPAK